MPRSSGMPSARRPSVWFSSLMSTPESRLVSRLSTGRRCRRCWSESVWRTPATGFPSSDTNQALEGKGDGPPPSPWRPGPGKDPEQECLLSLTLSNVPGTDRDSGRWWCSREVLAMAAGGLRISGTPPSSVGVCCHRCPVPEGGDSALWAGGFRGDGTSVGSSRSAPLLRPLLVHVEEGRRVQYGHRLVVEEQAVVERERSAHLLGGEAVRVICATTGGRRVLPRERLDLQSQGVFLAERRVVARVGAAALSRGRRVEATLLVPQCAPYRDLQRSVVVIGGRALVSLGQPQVGDTGHLFRKDK